MLWMKYEEMSYPCTLADANFAERFEEDKAVWLEACPCFATMYSVGQDEQGVTFCGLACNLSGPSALILFISVVVSLLLN
eukprot:g5234.t1